MDLRYLTEDLAVAGQISPNDIPVIAGQGFRSVVCNRPDSEDGAVAHQEVESAASQAGLQFRYIPVVSGGIVADNVTDMGEALKDLPKPVLAYCRSGARCTNLFALTKQAGY
ncbi:TIGR01244 family sulfur transferase [Notoacmeibacter sp. MSK16QG-6]|uniref:TIGR01244 family sulfur transferase n=1 Tax=Notoacmeibacter sp. MSK16QG-6 TaxID=2957982 RepID=UPI00209EB7FF|nr:TIGR01244 family sulfur transferase [Notoacmeibacter sp. MSK16QG-6]MCP1198489.1 TIGR01244 family sulfur transferase [Notoacmeibacter sp. MSK16QG-6]